MKNSLQVTKDEYPWATGAAIGVGVAVSRTLAPQLGWGLAAVAAAVTAGLTSLVVVYAARYVRRRRAAATASAVD